MWINPRIRAEREASAPKPPTPTGETLLELERSQGTTLRIALDEYNGAAYVSLSTWNADGWPVKGKTLSFRLRELPAILEALSRVADGPTSNRNIVTVAGPDPERPQYVDKGRRPEARNDHPLPPVTASTVPFDELGG